MKLSTVLNLIIFFTTQMLVNIAVFAFWPDWLGIVQSTLIFIIMIAINIFPWAMLSGVKNLPDIGFPISNWENKTKN